LAYGRDRGWRGGVEVSLKLSGTPAALGVTTRATIREFRHYDVSSNEPLRLDLNCTAQYSRPSDVLSNVNCQMPLGNGVVRVRGNETGVISPRAYDFSLNLENIGLQALVNLARHTTQSIPSDLVAAGTADGSYGIRKSEQDAYAVWTGEGHSSPVVLRSSVLSPELALPSLIFAAQQPAQTAPRARGHRRSNTTAQPQPMRIVLSHFRAPLGANTPADISGWLSGDGYEFDVAGDARIPRLLQAGRALGLRALQYPVEGTAKVDLKLAGNWAGFASPVLTGSAQLHSVTASVRGLGAPIQMPGAALVLASDSATLQNFNARFTGSPVQVGGQVRIARNCTGWEQCPIQFDLQTDDLSLDALNGLLNVKAAKRPWYNVFAGPGQHPALMRVQASGRLSAKRLDMGSVSAKRFTADVQLNAGKLSLKNVRAEVLGGTHLGEWYADFTGAQPSYSGSGSLQRVAMAQLASPMRDNWASGAVDASYKMTMSGLSQADLAKSMGASASFDWRNGVMRHVAVDGRSGPLKFNRFAGQLELRNGVINFAESQMTARGGTYTMSGTASLERQLGLNLRMGSRSYMVSGPLEKPKVAPVSVLNR
jgi:hypothetical protein